MILPVIDHELKGVTLSDALPHTAAFFSEDTPLKKAEQFGGRPYERREQQAEMACAVAEAFQNGRNLLVEAPTGVGKSFAYLVPAIYHAKAMHQCVLITTETINLQEQLAKKDLPLLQDLLDVDFTYAVAKGRSNYLCKRRLALAAGSHRDEILPADAPVSELQSLMDWSRTTHDGTLSDVPFRINQHLWTSVCCETSTCLGPKCSNFHSCFYWRARHSWDKADLLITNHALFFTNLKISRIEQQENCPLPEHCAVVFDEAHMLEDNAANHLGIHIYSSAVRGTLNRLFNPISGRGLLMKPGEDSIQVRNSIANAHEALTDFFAQFDDTLDKSPEQTFRVHQPGRFTDLVSDHVLDVETIARTYADNQDDAGFRLQLEAQLEHCADFREELNAFLNMSLPDQVYWIEGHKSGFSRTRQTELASAPLNVADLLRDLLFDSGKPVILTSATLAVKGSLTYYARRVGFRGGDGLILDSPFDYGKQVKLYVTKDMPQPNERGYNDAAAEKIRMFVEKTNGSAFVLFTSYNMLKYCSDRLSHGFLAKGINLLVHGESLSRSAMISEFKKVKSSVIFGATSFWTGVDVPGDALSNVIITKLPFAVPTHPLIQARCERIQKLGGNPFGDYSIPDAVLKFRQGIGRLIRSRTDTGIIVVLDPRIMTRSYGKSFLDSIPECPIEHF